MIDYYDTQFVCAFYMFLILITFCFYRMLIAKGVKKERIHKLLQDSCTEAKDIIR